MELDWYSLYIICFQFISAFLYQQIIHKETPSWKEKELSREFRQLRSQVETLHSPSTFVEYSKAKRRCLDLEKELELLQVNRLQRLQVYQKWKWRIGWFYRISVFSLSFVWSRYWKRNILVDCDWIWPMSKLLLSRYEKKKTTTTMGWQRCMVPGWIWGTVCEQATFILFCYLLGWLRYAQERISTHFVHRKQLHAHVE
jgi:hypothetical protein